MTLTAVPETTMSREPSKMVLVWKLRPMMAFAPNALSIERKKKPVLPSVVLLLLIFSLF